MRNISRRTTLLLPFATTAASPALAGNCDALSLAIGRAEEDIKNIDAWIATEGPKLVPMLESQLDDLIKKAASASAMAAASEKVELIKALSLCTTVSLIIVGTLFTPTLAVIVPLYVLGFGVSSTLLFAELSVAPQGLDGVDIVKVKSATEAQLYLDSVKAKDTVAVYKGAASKASNIISMWLIYHDLVELGKAAAAGDKWEAKRLELLKKAEKAKVDLEALKQSGNLRAFRLNELTLKKERLEANKIGCVVGPG